MEEKQIQEVIEKVLAGNATEAEKRLITEWYESRIEDQVIWKGDLVNEEAVVGHRILSNLHNHISVTKPRSFPARSRILWQAAAAFIGAIIISGYFFFKNNEKNPEAVTVEASASPRFSENKFVILPDSSTVLLHPGSQFHFAMNGKVREVKLSGEAYFDIRHDNKHPFVVYTGDVQTTVLGTAFNIKAYPGKTVTVSVTRGRVSVTDRLKNLTEILLPDNQAVYDKANEKLKVARVQKQDIISWIKEDVQFINIPFKSLIESLDRRYDVKISFSNPKMASCLITGRFNGTESLQQVLQVISETMGTTFKITDKVVVIDGQACN